MLFAGNSGTRCDDVARTASQGTTHRRSLPTESVVRPLQPATVSSLKAFGEKKKLSAHIAVDIDATRTCQQSNVDDPFAAPVSGPEINVCHQYDTRRSLPGARRAYLPAKIGMARRTCERLHSDRPAIRRCNSWCVTVRSGWVGPFSCNHMQDSERREQRKYSAKLHRSCPLCLLMVIKTPDRPKRYTHPGVKPHRFTGRGAYVYISEG